MPETRLRAGHIVRPWIQQQDQENEGREGNLLAPHDQQSRSRRKRENRIKPGEPDFCPWRSHAACSSIPDVHKTLQAEMQEFQGIFAHEFLSCGCVGIDKCDFSHGHIAIPFPAILPWMNSAAAGPQTAVKVPQIELVWEVAPYKNPAVHH